MKLEAVVLAVAAAAVAVASVEWVEAAAGLRLLGGMAAAVAAGCVVYLWRW